MATDKIKKALRPAEYMASPGAYEAAIAGVHTPGTEDTREYFYTEQKGGFQPNLKEGTQRNVFSTFALMQDNTATTEELIADRVKNADAYASRAQAIASSISQNMPQAFEKSSYLGTIVDLFPWMVEGVTNFGADIAMGAKNMPDTFRDIRSNMQLDTMLQGATPEEKENVNTALAKAYGTIRYKDKEPISMEDADSQLAYYHADLMKGKDDQPLTKHEQEIVEAFQKTLQTKAQNERNRMEEAFFREFEKRQIANAWVNPGMGATGVRAIGNIAGDALASGYAFQAVGLGPRLWGMGAAKKMGAWSRLLRLKGRENLSRAVKGRGLIRLKVAQETQKLKLPYYAEKVAAVERAGRYQLGIGKFVANNLPKVVALSSMAGGTGVFSLAFTTAFTDTRNELLAKGADWKTATGAAIASGFGEATLETLIGFRFLNKFLTEQKSFRNFLMKAVLPEGLEESSQTLWTESVKKAVGFNDREYSDIAADMLYSFLGGAMGGAWFGAGNYSSIAHNDRVLRTFEYEKRYKNSGEKYDSALLEFGKKQADIRAKYAAMSEKASEEMDQKRREHIREIRKALKGGIDPNWKVTEQLQIGEYDADVTKRFNEEEAARQKQMAQELASLREQYNIQLQNISNAQEGMKEGFTKLEQDILDKLHDEYYERAKKVNPEITIPQLERGWNGVRELLLHDGYTGEFTTAVSNAMDNMISFANAANKQLQQGFDSLTQKLGLNEQEKSAAMRLTSKDERERYNAELDTMEEAIIRDFSMAGAPVEGKAFAAMFRNQLGLLPMFATNEDGTTMSPLDFYKAMKPRIINVQNTLMHNEAIDNVNNLMLKATEQFDEPDNYIDDKGNIDYDAAYEKYLNTWNLITSYALAENEDVKKSILANINLALFNSYNYTDDVEFIKNYIENRAGKEYVIIDDMGLDCGKNATDEGFRVLALMRQKGLPFSFCARAIGLVRSFRGSGRSQAQLDAKYQAKLDEFYPAMTAEDKVWLNRIAKMEGVGKRPEYRDFTVDFTDQNRATYGKQANTEVDESAEQAKRQIREEEGYVEEEPDTDKITVTKANQQMLAVANELDSGKTDRYIVPNALYSRQGRTILVLNGQNQGEFLHEASHYMITEFLLNNIEIANIVGDKVFGPVNELVEELYGALKGGKNIRLNAVSKQETILDAIMDFIRTDGHTGNERVDAILKELQGLLNNEIMHIDKSRYNELTAEQKNNLRTAIKNLFKPTAGIELLESINKLDDMLNSKPIAQSKEAALELLNNYAIPDADRFTYHLSQNYDYLTTRAFIEEIKNEANLQAIALLLNNTDALESRVAKLTQSKSENENIQDDQVFFMAKAQNEAARKDSPVKFAREGKNWTERGLEGYEVSKEVLKNAPKYVGKLTSPFYNSLIDIANTVSPKLGPAIQNAMYSHDQLVKEGQYYGTLFMDTLAKQNKTNNPILQDEYDINFVDKLNNLYIDEAKAWIVSRASTPELAAKFEEAFNGMISFLNTSKAMMVDLEVKANWMADGTFFPRAIDNYDKFSEEYLRLLPEGLYAKMVDLKLIDAKKGVVKREEMQYSLQRAFASLVRNGNNAEGRVSFLQNRVITEVTPEMRKYYKDPIDAYMDYVKDAATTILTRNLIGASHDSLNIDDNGNMNSILNAGEIYRVLKGEGLLKEGRIDLSGMTDEQIAEVKEREEHIREFNKALSAFINRHREYNKGWKYTNDILTTTMLAHASTALSQGQEMITTAWLFGMANTAKAAADVIKGKNPISIQDLGIDELEDAYKAMTTGTMELVANGALKYSGFKMMDVYFKNVAVNAIYNYFNNALQKPGSPEYNRAKDIIEKSFSGLKDYETRVAALMDNLANRKITDDVKFLMYDVFAKQQPINAANISYGYNAVNPLGRLCLYKFNTVAYRQVHAIVNRLKENFTKVGSDGKTHLDFARGFLEVLRFLLFCGIIGVPLETAKNLLNGRSEFNPKKDFIFSAGQCFLMGEYDAKTFAREGFGSFVQNKLTPPLTPLNWLSQDVRDLFKGNYSAKSLKGLPVGGRVLHGILYSLVNTKNDGIGYDFDFFGVNSEDDFTWG